MTYMQGTALQRVFSGSLEDQVLVIKKAIGEHFGDSDVTILATHMDHGFALDANGALLKLSYSIEEGVVKDIVAKPSKAVPIIAEEDVPAFVAKQLKSITRKMMRGKPIERTQVREVAQLVKQGEDYWLTDVLSKLEEAVEEGWMQMYEANHEQIRTSLHGRIRQIESEVPSTRYAKIAKGKLSEFKSELTDSVSVLRDVLQHIVDECSAMVFDQEQDEFFGAIRKSLIAEAQAVAGLLGKAEKLLGSEDMGRIAVAHDRLAERSRTMAIVSEYMKDRAQTTTRSNDDGQ